MHLLQSIVIVAALSGSCIANVEYSDDAQDNVGTDRTIAYHAVPPSAMAITMPNLSSTPLPLPPPPLSDPLPTANLASAAAAAGVIIHPANDSFLEATTAMFGTIGMLILLFRRRINPA